MWLLPAHAQSDISGDEALIEHYYASILGRSADAGGAGFWRGEGERMGANGVRPSEAYLAMARYFFASDEFQSRNLGPEPFVGALYQTFLNRAADGPGLAYWGDQINAGLPRDMVMYAFMFSAEFETVITQALGGAPMRAEAGVVVDFYRGALGRLPDSDGLAYWAGRFQEAQQLALSERTGGVYQAAIDISASFFDSAEYWSDPPTPQRYVSDLYNAFMRRSADLAGFNFWVDELTSGRLTHAQVRRAFIDSSEFGQRVAAIADADNIFAVEVTATWVDAVIQSLSESVFEEVPAGEPFFWLPDLGPARERSEYWTLSVLSGAGFRVEEVDGLQVLRLDTDGLAPGSVHVAQIRVEGANVTRNVTVQVTILARHTVLEGVLGPAGGTFTSPGGRYEIRAPAGALQAATALRLVRVDLAEGSSAYVLERVDGELLPPNITYGIDPDVIEPGSAFALQAEAIQLLFNRDGWNVWRISRGDFFETNVPDNFVDSTRNRVARATRASIPQYEWRSDFLLSQRSWYSFDGLASALRSRCAQGNATCLARPPVLLVHGYSTNDGARVEGASYGRWDYWNALPQLLENDYAVFEFRWTTAQRFENAAYELGQAIDAIRSATGQDVAVVAHSFGGLLSRTYLQGLARNLDHPSSTDQPYAYQGGVRNLLTIGTPHGGIANQVGTRHGQCMPEGVDGIAGALIGNCLSIACHQAGQSSDRFYRARHGVSPIETTHLLHGLFGIAVEPGEIVAKLESAQTNTVPVPTLVLIGLRGTTLPFGGSVSIDSGDGLIHFQSQRASPALTCAGAGGGCSCNNIGLPLATGGASVGRYQSVVETVLGHSGAYYFSGSSRIDVDSPRPGYRAETFTGYFHSGPVATAEQWLSSFGRTQTDIGAGNAAQHQVYQEILAWLSPDGEDSGKLNDTGITWSGHATSGNATTCEPSHPVGQDCHYGRDARAAAGTLTKVGGGNAGFDFTKIANNGTVLPASATLGSGPNDWACTRDNVTGLIWEVKVNNSAHLRHKDHTYTWYDPASPDGNPGRLGNTSSCSNTLGGQGCNTHYYAVAVSAQGLCGASDWRMPTRRELQGIADYGRLSPAIDTGYFPNTTSSNFWSGSPYATDSGAAWLVGFANGGAGGNGRLFRSRVRLVRGGQ